MEIRDVGGQLRASRETRGVSIGILAQRTRVQPRILEAIERNDLSLIPPKPFGRGFVRAYATEVGLDPDQTVRDYFARFAPPVVPGEIPAAAPAARPGVPIPRRAAPLAVGLIAIATLAVLTFGRDSSTTVEPGAVGTSGEPPALAASGPVAASPAPLATVPGPESPSRLLVTLDVTRVCWVTASVDGERTVYALLQPGTRRALSGTREVVIRAGDAGALSWSVNGREVAPFGKPGEVRTVRVTRENAASVR
ncbi:MAG TPA: RodZ domain-containing protein [Vicinamibacterales bacterium]|nr:RodZ domain-containing protein [Vicinamibacterales bacterium]